MYIVPVLVAVDAPDTARAEGRAAELTGGHALHVDAARRLPPPRAALAEFYVLVYADGIELPPAATPH
jgi:hypothetical protein